MLRVQASRLALPLRQARGMATKVSRRGGRAAAAAAATVAAACLQGTAHPHACLSLFAHQPSSSTLWTTHHRPCAAPSVTFHYFPHIAPHCPQVELPDFDFDYSALEPAISGRIMELHHSGHHKARALLGGGGCRRASGGGEAAAGCGSCSHHPARVG